MKVVRAAGDGGLLCLLAGTLAAVATAPVAAQGVDPAASAAFHAGPIAFTPSLDVPGIGVDSNVFNDAQNPKSDLTGQIQPQIQAWMRFGRARISASEQLNFVYFRSYASERAVNTNSNVRLDLLLSRGTAYVGAAFVKTNDRPGPEIDTRAQHRRNPITAGMDLRVSAKTSLDVGTDYEHVNFENGTTFGLANLKNELDRTTRAYRATLKYSITPPTALTFTVLEQDSQFQFSPDRDSHSLRIVPGVVFAPFALITGRAEVGFLRLTPRDTRIRRFNGPVAQVDLGYVLMGATRFGVQVSRDVLPSVDRVENYFVQMGVAATVTHRISERWDALVGANQQRLDYGSNATATAAATFTGADVVRTYNAGLGFYFSRGLRLGVRGEHASRESGRPNGDYQNVRLMTSINYTFR